MTTTHRVTFVETRTGKTTYKTRKLYQKPVCGCSPATHIIAGILAEKHGCDYAKMVDLVKRESSAFNEQRAFCDEDGTYIVTEIY